jgi:hypothetical protein
MPSRAGPGGQGGKHRVLTNAPTLGFEIRLGEPWRVRQAAPPAAPREAGFRHFPSTAPPA